MESSRDDKLAATLSSLRPAPRPAFAAELDEGAAAGFPRRSPAGRSPFADLVARLRAMPPRRALLPVGAVALTAIVVATTVVATTDSGSIGTLSNNSAVETSASNSAGPPNPAHHRPRRPASMNHLPSPLRVPRRPVRPKLGAKRPYPSSKPKFPPWKATPPQGSAAQSTIALAPRAPTPPRPTTATSNARPRWSSLPTRPRSEAMP